MRNEMELAKKFFGANEIEIPTRRKLWEKIEELTKKATPSSPALGVAEVQKAYKNKSSADMLYLLTQSNTKITIVCDEVDWNNGNPIYSKYTIYFPDWNAPFCGETLGEAIEEAYKKVYKNALKKES